MKNSERRKYLFNIFSENFEKICSDNCWNDLLSNNIKNYCCPLCETIFSESSLKLSSENPLSLEHVPPDSLGGKPMILTCKKCNNSSGHKDDEELRKFFYVESFLLGEGEIEGKFKFNDSNTFKAKVELCHKKKKFKVVISKKSQYAREQIKKAKGSNVNFKLDSNIEIHNRRKAELAIIKFAYLFAFAQFGYAYLLSIGGKYIQQAIRESSADLNCIIIRENIPMTEAGIYYVKAKNNIVLMALMEFKINKKKSLIGILLPGPTIESLESFKTFKSDVEQNIETSIIPAKNLIEDPYNFFKFWRRMQSG